MYMLDTNMVSEALRNPRGSVAMRIRQVPDGEIAVSIVVAAELRFGVRKRGSAALTSLVEGFLMRTAILPLECGADDCYAEIRAALEKAGTPIDANDMLIAAHALALNAVLVTDNVSEFARIDGIKLENWIRP
jgi:tRNA(fMet)-specific endonuclease VapC